tara:strand:- start:385 stop:1686 length:1302 start_codon:yes stop_codon:yes gene_type:complete
VGIKILHGSCLDRLKDLEDQSINTCITSPPYWGLRDYGTAEWEGGDENCDHLEKISGMSDKNTLGPNKHLPNTNQANISGKIQYKNVCAKCCAVRKDKQLGMEDTPEEFVNNLVQVFKEVKRVLRDDGTVWLNLGDSYAGNNSRASNNGRAGYGEKREGVFTKTGENLKSKDLVGIPWRVAFALQADGWYLRQDIIWHKPNPMPESVRDRCTKAHEYIFLLSKSPKYYFDNEAIKEDAKFPDGPNSPHKIKAVENVYSANLQKIGANPKRNKRSVWTVTTKPFKGAHFATFPMDLIEPCVLAGCPEKVCAECNGPYVRQVESKRIMRNELPKDDPRYRPNTYEGSYKDINGMPGHAGYTETKDLGLQKQCDCKTNETKSGTVLDPFGGSGTTAQVANSHNRDAILIELNEEYIEIAKERIAPDGDLFTEIEVF